MSEIRSGGNSDLTTPRGFDNEACVNAFLSELGDEITGACLIPINLPKKEVLNIIKRAKKWFYKNYEYSVKENLYHIPNGVFETEYFKKHRALHLPGASEDGSGSVFSVYGLHDLASGWTGGGGSDIRFQGGSDFALERMLFKNVYEGSGAAMAAEELQYYVINQSLADLSRQILENPISFAYSRLTGELKFLGDTPRGDVIIEVYETIHDCALFEDEIFFRYVSAQVKKSLGAKLGVFKFTLPGGVDFDYEAIKSMGEEELSAIIEEIKGDEGVDWMMHS